LLAYNVETTGASTNTPITGTYNGTFTNNDLNTDQLTFVPEKSWVRAPVAVVNRDSNSGPDGTGFLPSATTRAQIVTRTIDSAGSSDVGRNFVFGLGYDSDSTAVHGGRGNLLFDVHSSLIRPRLIVGQMDSTGVTIGAEQFTSVFFSGGTVYAKPAIQYANAVVVVGTPITTAGGAQCMVVQADADEFQLATLDSSNSFTEYPTNFMILVEESHVAHLEQGRVVQCPFRKPRMLAIYITISKGTPSISTGVGHATVADTGTGRYTLTYTDAFAREPVVVASCHHSGTNTFASIRSSSATGVEVNCSNALGALADPTGMYVLIVGSDSSEDY
jgi:hypothetical protein